MRKFPYIYMAVAGLLVTVSPLPLMAQQDPATLEVRGSVQDNFIRIVFSGDSLPDASVDESQANSLKITFNRAVTLTGDTDFAVLSPKPSLSHDGATVTLNVPGLERQRHVQLGRRLLVDLFTKDTPKEGKAAAKTEPAPAPVTAPVAQTAPAPAGDAASLVTDDKPETETTTKTITETPPVAAAPEAAAVAAPVTIPLETETVPMVEAAPVTPVEAAPMQIQPPADPGAPFTGSAIITVGSTQGVSLASFERQGYLWIVTSRESLGVPPLISGPSAAQLGRIEPVKIEGGSAYRVKLPKGAFVYPEGGGLVWRLVVVPKDPALQGVPIDRDFSDTALGPQLHIPLSGATGVLRVPDPSIGDDLAVVLMGRAGARMREDDAYVDFDLIPAIVGAVIRPKADGLSIAVLPDKIDVTRQGGLRMSAAGPSTGAVTIADSGSGDKKTEARYVPTRMFDFVNWGLGGTSNYLPMRRSIDERVAMAEEDAKLPEIIGGAKFMLAQGLPQEATGFIQMALGYLPLLRESAEFQAIRGAIAGLAGESADSLAAFQIAGLENNDEIMLWKAFALAQDKKLSDAQKMLPHKAVLPLVASYPPRIQALILPDLIETVMSRGDVNLAEQMIDIFEDAADGSVYRDRDQVTSYYRGRAATLRGDYQAATDYFREAADGITGPYPVRATLMLVQRGLSSKTIAREDAIRKLERFRFGWRGDSLESEVLEKLGMIYVTGGEQRRGLSILRDAATMASTPEDRDGLVAVMQKAFSELFSGKTKEKMSAMESAAVASEFAELMPAGGEGEQITLTIADQMMAVDLLDRAADMIEPMVERTANLREALQYAQKAAGIRITDRRPEEALRVLDKALSRPDAKVIPEKDMRSIALLRARAKADMKRTSDAFAELNAIPEGDDSLRLMADTAWKTQNWEIAADAFGKLIKRAGLDATRPPTQEQAQMILNRALALNLSGQNEELSSLSVSYGDIMRRSELYRPFQLVTRTAREAQLADRETLLKLVSEVDLFKDVLDSYKTKNVKPAAPTGDKAKTAAAPAPKAAADKAKEAATEAATSDKKPAAEAKPAATAPTEPGQN